jgi:hypothetical protein
VLAEPSTTQPEAAGCRRSEPRLLRDTCRSLLGAGALVLLPAVASFIYITLFGVNLVFQDDWEFVPLISRAQTRTLTFQALFAQHNEHRILLPRLVMLSNVYLTHFNTKAEMYLYWFCLCIICCLLLLVFVKANGLTARSLLLFAPVSFLVFGLRQWVNLTWGWQISWGLAMLFLVLAVYLLQVQSRASVALAGAAVCGAVASFSVFAGLLVWPVGVVEIVCLNRARPPQRLGPRLAAWLAAAAMVFIIYFHGYRSPAGLPSPFYSLLHPVDGLVYFLTALGLPLAVDQTDAAAVGAALLCLVAFGAVGQWGRPISRSVAVWLSITALLVAFAGILTAGRSGGVLTATAMSIYSTFGLIGAAGLYLWIVTNPGWGGRLRVPALGVMLVLLLAGALAGTFDAAEQGVNIATTRGAMTGYLRNYANEPNKNLSPIYGLGPECLRMRAPVLEQNRLNVFYGSRLDAGDASAPLSLPVPNDCPPTPPPPVICSHATINADPTDSLISIGATVQLTAMANCGGTPIYAWWLATINGPTTTWLPLTPYSTSDAFSWDTSELAPGSYAVVAWVENQDRFAPADKFDTYTLKSFLLR